MWENRERLEWKEREWERGSVPWSKRNAPRIRNDGSLNLVWERRERKLEFTWNGKGSYVWNGRRSEGVKEEKEGSELGMEKERSGRS